jgi:hypothetical protein
MDLLVELIDRQADFLLRRTDNRAFLIQVEPFLVALQAEPELVAHLDDMLQDVVDIAEVMESADAELTSELLELRRELVELRPEVNECGVERVSDAGVGAGAAGNGQNTLAFFDEFASGEPGPFNADGVGGRAGTLLSILQGKDAAPSLRRVSDAASVGELARDPLELWRRRLWNIQSRYDHAVRSMRLRLGTSAGLALLKLEAVTAAINPSATLLDVDDANLTAADDLLRWGRSEAYSLFNAVWGGQRGSGNVDDRVAELREGVDRLREDLRRRRFSARPWPTEADPQNER